MTEAPEIIWMMIGHPDWPSENECGEWNSTFQEAMQDVTQTKYRRADLPPKVKALVWSNGFAHMAGVLFKVEQVGVDFILERHQGSSVMKSCHQSEEDAKEFAQSKAERMVLGCLEGVE